MKETLKKDKRITALTDVALITCVVQKGMADDVIKAARDAGAQGSTVFYARGYGMRERLGLLGVAVDVEKEVVNIVVSTDQADRIFERMSVAAKMDTPGMGFMYMTHLDKAVTYIPPEILEKLQPK